MKLLCLSDLHLDRNEQETGQRLISDLVLFIEKKACDAILISGDIAGSSKKAISYLDQLCEHLSIPVYFIPGNHDIWSSHDSKKAYDDLCAHSSCIENKIIPLNDHHVLVGWMGWYDYSFKPDYLFYDQVISDKKQHWADHKYAHWGKSDPDWYNELFQQLNVLLEATRDKQVILSTHFVPSKKFITYRSFDKVWNSCNAFMGSENTEYLIEEYPNIDYVFFGHTHFVHKEKNPSGTSFICTPLGYQHEWSDNPFLPLSFTEALEKRHFILNLEDQK